MGHLSCARSIAPCRVVVIALLALVLPMLAGTALAQPSGTPVGFEAGGALVGNFLIHSGSGSHPSQIIDGRSKKVTPLVRGLTLVGFLDGLGAYKLAHLDSCGKTENDHVRLAKDFQSIISLMKSRFGGFAIVSHDSAVCSGTELAPLFAGTGFTRWQELKFRTPYIAIIAGDGKTAEFVGTPENLLAVNATKFLAPVAPDRQRRVEALPRVAHAAGGYKGLTYTNTLDALNHNANRFDVFELDFSTTTDGHIVCLHDWEGSFEVAFKRKSAGGVTLKEFEKLALARTGLRNCTLDSLAAWLARNPKATIVTDVKDFNVDALRRIATQYPKLVDRFVPQAYHPLEYFAIRDLGFRNVIWTLYMFIGEDEIVLDWLRIMDLYALTIPTNRAARELGRRARATSGVLSYVHTINNRDDFQRFINLGVAEIYTDWLERY